MAHNHIYSGAKAPVSYPCYPFIRPCRGVITSVYNYAHLVGHVLRRDPQHPLHQSTFSSSSGPYPQKLTTEEECAWTLKVIIEKKNIIATGPNLGVP